MAVRFDADGEDYTRALGLGSQGAFTLALWLKISVDRNTYSCPISVDNGTGDYAYVETDTDGVTLRAWDEGTYSAAGLGSRVLTVGTWYFVALVCNGANVTFYTMAESETALTTSGSASNFSSATNMATLRLGESPWGSEWWNGAVCAVKIWTAALTAAELLNEAWRYLPCRTENLRAWYPLDRAGTTDFSGNGQTLSGGSGVATEDGPGLSWGFAEPTLVLPAGSAATNANAEAATAVAAADDAAPSVAPSAQDAGATATAGDPSASVAASSEVATATAAGHDATTAVAPVSEAAVAAAAGQDPGVSIAVPAEAAEAAAAALDATAVFARDAPAEAAEATAAALDATVAVAPTAEAAATAAAGLDASASAAPSVGAAEAAASGHDPSVSVAPSAEAATSAASAHDAAVIVGTLANAEAAAATAEGLDPSAAVAPGVEAADGTGEAFDAGPAVAPSASSADASAVAGDPSVSVASSAEPASGAAAGLDAAGSVAPSAESASATASGLDVSGAVAPASEGASASASAQDPSVSVAVSAEAATGTAAALDAAVTAGSNVSAECAAAGAAALDASVLAVDGAPEPAPAVEQGSWYGLLEIVESGRRLAEEERSRPPTHCPNDATRLLTGPDGDRYCPWDGWRPLGARPTGPDMRVPAFREPEAEPAEWPGWGSGG